jgi:hypothetical protein
MQSYSLTGALSPALLPIVLLALGEDGVYYTFELETEPGLGGSWRLAELGTRAPPDTGNQASAIRQ